MARHDSRQQSVGNAASLFGGGEDDFFNSLSAEAAPAAAYQTQGIGTVFEEEEPESPQVGSYSAEGGWGAAPDGAHGYDQGYGNYAPETSYAAPAPAQSAYDQQATAYPDIPYYPGYVYDPTSNTYLLDPSAELEQWPPQEGEYAHTGAGYDAGAEQDRSQYGQPGAASAAPYQQEQQSDYTASWQHDAPAAAEPYPTQEQHAYAPHSQPYAQQAPLDSSYASYAAPTRDAFAPALQSPAAAYDYTQATYQQQQGSYGDSSYEPASTSSYDNAYGTGTESAVQGSYAAAEPSPVVFAPPPRASSATLPPPRASVAPPPRATSSTSPFPTTVHSAPAGYPHVPTSPSKLVSMSKYQSSDSSTNATPGGTPPPPRALYAEESPYGTQAEFGDENGYANAGYGAYEAESSQSVYSAEQMHEAYTPDELDEEGGTTTSWNGSSHAYGQVGGHDAEAAARAMEPEEPTMVIPPRNPFEERRPVAALPPHVAPSSPRVDSLTESLSATSLVDPAPVQLRRRSFGRQQSKNSASPSASPRLDSISLASVPSSPVLVANGVSGVKHTQAVPALNFEAPSPELRSEEGREVEGTWNLGQSVETEEQGGEQSYDASSPMYDSGYTPPAASYSYDAAGTYSPPVQTTEYGFDDSLVFGESDTGGLSSSASVASGYGEWTGSSDAQEGYDYVQPANDTYAAMAATPPPHSYALPGPHGAPEQGYGSPQSLLYSPERANPPQLYGSPQRAMQAPRSAATDAYASYDASRAAPPVRSGSTPSYASFPAQHTADPYAARSAGVPASTPYGALQHGLQSARPSSADPYSSMTARAYDPYAARPALDRRASSSVANTALPDLGLGRSPAPVVTFGFGGRMLVVFPNAARSSYGMDNGLYGAVPSLDTSPSTPSTVHIRKLADAIPASESTTFPGPIFMDGGKANAGKKRKEAVAWLDARIGELALGSAGDVKAQTRSTLIQLVKVLVENEGKISGTAKLDETVRSILVPDTSATDVSYADLPTASELASLLPTPVIDGSSKPVTTYAVTGSNLDSLSAFLMRGERRKAVKYALDHKMWAHAFVIASCVDTDCYKDVVAEFLQSELTPLPGDASSVDSRQGLRVAYSMFAGLGADSIQQFLPTQALNAPVQPRRTSSNLMLGQGAIPRAMTPVSPRFPESNVAPRLSHAALHKWQDTAAMIVANRTAGDSAALTSLGDTLSANGWTDAAHICYLLSPATSPIGGVGSPSARLVLIGGAMPTAWSTTGIDLESIMLSELVEFAFSLGPTTKGQEPFVGFPHLQAFRLYHACQLVDAGQISQAQRYTDAIVGTLKLATKPSPFYHPGLVAQVKTVSDRLVTAPGHDKGGSWITRNVPRPTIDSLWSTLEGRFTKFVSGEGEAIAATLVVKAEAVKATAGPIGPFTHFSSISPASTSGTLSRQASQSELASQDPPRPSSAAALAPIMGPPPVKRAPFKTHHSRSSSLGFVGYDYNPSAPPPWQAYVPNPSTAPSVDATPKSSQQEFSAASPYRYAQESSGYGEASYGQEPAGHGEEPGSEQPSAYASSYEQPAAYQEDSQYGAAEQTTAANDSGWGSPSWQSGGDAAAPRAPMFSPVAENFAEDDSGFISPMAAFSPSPSPGPAMAYSPLNPQSHKRTSTRDELDDLGIGNSKSRKPTFDAIDEQAGEGEDAATGVPAASAPPKAERPAIKQSRSWLGGWFKREPDSQQAGPGPVKANLGEQTSFVFDPELKRWVNKKTGGDTGAPLTTAPPPRAATASPTRAMRANVPPPRFASATPPPMDTGRGPPRTFGAPPPMNRSKTSADLGDQNRAGAGQFRSASTGPPPMPSMPPRGPGSGMTSPPPPAGAAAPGRRKPLKSRYVATPI